MSVIQIGRYLLTLLTGELPKPISDVLLIVGGAPGGIEAAQAFAKETKCDVCAVNGTIAKYPGALLLAVSAQEHLVTGWVAARKYKKSRPCVISNDPLPAGVEGELDAVVALNTACPSSGLYAALIGRAMGYKRIVLAGIDLNRKGESRTDDERRAYEGLVNAAVKSGALEGVESLSTGWLAQALRAKH